MERGKTTVYEAKHRVAVVLPFVRLDTPTALSSADDYVLLLVGLNKPHPPVRPSYHDARKLLIPSENN